jgi:predicted DNA-binding protein
MSGLVRKVIEDWLEDYEDMLLARRAEEAEERWIKDGCKTISGEELCRELGIELNLEENPEETLLNFPKTSKKESSRRSIKGSRSRHKTVNR